MARVCRLTRRQEYDRKYGYWKSQLVGAMKTFENLCDEFPEFKLEAYIEVKSAVTFLNVIKDKTEAQHEQGEKPIV